MMCFPQAAYREAQRSTSVDVGPRNERRSHPVPASQPFSPAYRLPPSAYAPAVFDPYGFYDQHAYPAAFYHNNPHQQQHNANVYMSHPGRFDVLHGLAAGPPAHPWTGQGAEGGGGGHSALDDAIRRAYSYAQAKEVARGSFSSESAGAHGGEEQVQVQEQEEEDVFGRGGGGNGRGYTGGRGGGSGLYHRGHGVQHRHGRGGNARSSFHPHPHAPSPAMPDPNHNPLHAPPDKNMLNIAAIESGLDTRTTVMIKNIPNKMSDVDLLRFLSREGVARRRVDFFYLRMDFGNGELFVCFF